MSLPLSNDVPAGFVGVAAGKDEKGDLEGPLLLVAGFVTKPAGFDVRFGPGSLVNGPLLLDANGACWGLEDSSGMVLWMTSGRLRDPRFLSTKFWEKL